jgi:hypothetical protein
MNMAEAQPTPLSTAMAMAGQFNAHAPHSMQAAESARRTALPSGAKTACGQTLMHIPQLMHRSRSYRRVFRVYELKLMLSLSVR